MLASFTDLFGRAPAWPRKLVKAGQSAFERLCNLSESCVSFRCVLDFSFLHKAKGIAR